MADDNNKSAEEASSLFHNIMKASVTGGSKKEKQSYCFELPKGEKVVVDPSSDERVIFTIQPIVGKAQSFAYLESSNIMSDYPVVGSFSQNDTNALAVTTYLKLKSAGELKSCD